ncbi:MAG: fatty acid--CoA ligase family protein [Acidobacteriia bacterium]|nr:fatty acid--CoA ligase family protein [Terriglobia bacterium]
MDAADRLKQQLADRKIQRLLLQSNDPAQIVAALVACADAHTDLVIAHDYLDRGLIDRVIEDVSVDAVACQEVGHIRAVPGAGGSSEPASGKVLLMTSGTTGVPKVAAHTLDKLLDRIRATSSVESNVGGRWLLTYQPTGFAGLQVILTACLTSGSVVIASDRTPSEFAEAVERHAVTHISGTATFWRSFLVARRGLLAGGSTSPGSLRQITLGGEAVDQTLLDRLAAAFPDTRITQIYASTEGGALFAVHDQKEGFPAAWLEQGVQGSRLRVVDDELQVLSPRKMLGYASGQASPISGDGWLGTGDLVRVDQDRVRFVGRRDALINIAGSKVFPNEIETFLLSLPGITEAKVRGVPSPITGQAVLAEIVVEKGTDAEPVRRATMQSCRSQLARHKVPSMIRVLPAIEVSPSGKKA